MKRIIVFVYIFILVLFVNAQNYNNERIVLTNFLIRMYNNAPFEGVRIVNDYNGTYLISALALDKAKYRTDAIMNRVASVKAMANASRYFNGSNITSDIIIHTTEKSAGKSETEIIENIRENSVGYVKALEQLTNFTCNNSKQVFIYVTPLKLKEK